MAKNDLYDVNLYLSVFNAYTTINKLMSIYIAIIIFICKHKHIFKYLHKYRGWLCLYYVNNCVIQFTIHNSKYIVYK